MKVYIGPHCNWFGPYQLCELLKYFGVSQETRDSLAEKLPEKPFSWFDKKFKKRNIKVRIDDYDTWSMDHTLALIILPMLKQLKATKHGAPNVDDDDVPEHLRSTAAKPKEEEWDVDEFHFQRWDYVIDEMIFAFESIVDESWEEQFYSGKTDWQWKITNPEEPDREKHLSEMIEGPNHTLKIDVNGLKVYNDRINNGTRLFGKYFRNLWD